MQLKSNSQAGQDIFAALMTRKTNGYFIDLGASEPIAHNNTYMLETELGWNGLLVDISPKNIDDCKNARSPKNIYLEYDLLKKPLIEIFKENNVPNNIDYISFDVDTADIHLARTFPYGSYKTSCFTFEHDGYCQGDAVKNESRAIFLNNGYSLIFGDIDYNHGCFEDWYVSDEIASQIRLFKPIAERIHFSHAIALLNSLVR